MKLGIFGIQLQGVVFQEKKTTQGEKGHFFSALRSFRERGTRECVEEKKKKLGRPPAYSLEEKILNPAVSTRGKGVQKKIARVRRVIREKRRKKELPPGTLPMQAPRKGRVTRRPLRNFVWHQGGLKIHRKEKRRGRFNQFKPRPRKGLIIACKKSPVKETQGVLLAEKKEEGLAVAFRQGGKGPGIQENLRARLPSL